VNAAQNWRDQLAAWAIPPEILAGVDESPWVLPVGHFVRRAQRYAAETVGASYARAVEALGTPGTVLDVGAGAGAAGLPLLGTGRVTGLTAVDTSTEMLDTLPSGTETVVGRWPDVAAKTPYVDVVVCHHVFYNVPDLGDFALALTDHARRRVVAELTERHPLTVLNELWRRFHGLERPTGPTAEDAVAVLHEIGIAPREQRWADPEPAADVTDSVIESTRRRLCLPPERTLDVADALRDNPSVPLARVTLWWDV
jgi:SAM-dependent methyltransferase